MKFLYLLLITASFSISIFGQKNILCSSGQIIEIDGANNFIATNAESLIEKFKAKDENQKTLLSYLYDLEKVNRLKVAAIDKDIVILEYDMKRASSPDKKTFKNKIAIFKKDTKTLDQTEKLMVNEIKSILKHDERAITQLYIKYNLTLAESPRVDTIKPTNNPITVVNEKKDDVEIDSVASVAEKAEESVTTTLPKIEIKKTSKSANELLKDCTIEFNGKNSLNKKQTTLASSRLLTYTPEKVKSYYKLSDFLSISASLEKLEGKTYINIEARFNSKDAMKSYGKIYKSDFLRLEFISGKKVFLSSVESCEPALEKHTGHSIYKAKYLFASKYDVDILENEYLDKVGIMWSSGFEAYPVYDVDFFQRQVTCLKSAK
jgi:hypothetical protein